MVKGDRFYCSYEIKNSQRHLEESGAEREISGLNMAMRDIGAEHRKSGTKREGVTHEHKHSKIAGLEGDE